MNQPDSFIFKTITRYTFFFINLFSLYLLLRGHNLPGGGFIAGLVTASSLILLSLALGLDEIHRIIRVDPVRVAAAGLLLAGGTPLLPLFLGRPYFEHAHLHLTSVPLFGELHLGTTLLFDAGVFLVVVGIAAKVIFILSYSTQGRQAFVETEQRLYASALETPIEAEAASLPPRAGKEDRDAA